MKKQGRYHHFGVDWPGESFSESITLCGVEGEDVGTGQTLCPDCAQVAITLNFCGLGPESLRQFFSALRTIDPFALKAEIEALRGRAVEINKLRGSGESQLTECLYGLWRVAGKVLRCYTLSPDWSGGLLLLGGHPAMKC